VITGYNTDVKRNGQVFHVQTEDKGVKNPVIETLVYLGGGQIIASRQYTYAGLVADGKVDERAVAELLESQHRQVMRWIQGGRFDPGGPPPFGATIISERSFDELVLEFLRSQEGAEPIEIVLAEEAKARAGAPCEMKLLIRSEGRSQPVPGAQVTITLAGPGTLPVKLLTAASGADGIVAARVRCPVDAGGGTLQVEAHHGAHAGALEIPIEAA